jgi:hypothetical protein
MKKFWCWLLNRPTHVKSLVEFGRVVDVSHNHPLDPIYHGPTRGEPVPDCYRYAPVLIPAREPIIPPTIMSEEDLEQGRRTGLYPAFQRLVGNLNPLAFEPIKGVQIVTWQGPMMFALQLLVGEKKEPFGYLHHRRLGHLCVYTSRASARRAKSRFLKRLTAGDLGVESKKERDAWYALQRYIASPETVKKVILP